LEKALRQVKDGKKRMSNQREKREAASPCQTMGGLRKKEEVYPPDNPCRKCKTAPKQWAEDPKEGEKKIKVCGKHIVFKGGKKKGLKQK